MKNPKDHLTEPELAIVQKHLGVIGQLQALIATRQEALNDIAGLALSARGFSPVTHDIDNSGTITEKPKGETKE
jgi:hypothetical protein|tara:strand:+ start:658 stop:879 length:222 start_codon:yes stop_codon:yes gene_type:complete